MRPVLIALLAFATLAMLLVSSGCVFAARGPRGGAVVVRAPRPAAVIVAPRPKAVVVRGAVCVR